MRLLVRGGYFFRPTPVPDQDSLANFVDSHTHVFSAGLGITGFDFTKILTRPISFDAYFQAHVLQPRDVVKALPNDPTGDYRISGYVLCGGGMLTVRF